jgi:hypothetical protein
MAVMPGVMGSDAGSAVAVVTCVHVALVSVANSFEMSGMAVPTSLFLDKEEHVSMCPIW